MKSLYLFLGLVALSMVLAFLMQSFILTENLYYYAFSEQLSNDRINMILETRKEWRWVGYAFMPVFMGFKMLLVSGCLFTWLFLANLKIGFGAILRIAIKAEFVFILPPLITLGWFSFIYTDYTLQDIFNFKPWSLLSLFTSEIEPWKKFSLSYVNFFQALYMGVLAYWLSEELTITYKESLKGVLLSYGSGLALWVTFFVFLIAISG
jgi:hypothetical protein